MRSHTAEKYASGSTRALIARIFRKGRKPRRIRRVEWRSFTIKARGDV